MSSAADSAVATAPLERGIEILERRLIELRADIDAILTQLASHKAMSAAVELPGTPEPEAIAEAQPAVAAAALPGSDLPSQDEVTPEPSLSSDEMDQLADAPQMDATVPDQPSAAKISPKTAVGAELPSTEPKACDDPTPIASTDASLAGRLNGLDMQLHAAVASVAETAAGQAQMQVEPERETATMPIAPSSSMKSVASAPESAVDGVPASASPPAEMPVISLQSHQRKQKRGFSAGTSAQTRPGRRLATKIAASIVALLAAATMLMIADKAAVGSEQSLPWMSPLPSSYEPSGASWSVLGFRQAAGQVSTVADRSTNPAPAAAADDALLSRYREAWPIGW
jgi:hypothetical protein